jgi:hypothetical protein
MATFDGRDTVVLFEELAYEDVLSVDWVPRAADWSATQIEQNMQRNLRVLRTCDALDETRGAEKSDDDSPLAGEVARLEFKVDLLLELVGQVLAQSRPRPPAVPVRFNALGASWQSAGAVPDSGAGGLLRVYLRDALVDPLTLAAQIVSVGPTGLVRARFEMIGESVADQLERLVFRRHRRQVAETRVPRRG